MGKHLRHFYDFGPFRVDAVDRLLLRDGEIVSLTPKAFDVLLVLVETSGQVLTRDELMKRVWPDTNVEEANLSHYVYKLRAALGEDRDEGKYVETLSRRGYRFVARVSEIQDQREDLVIEEHTRARIVIEEETNEGPATETIAPINIYPAALSAPQPSWLRGHRSTLLMIGLGLLILTVTTVVWRGRLKVTPQPSGPKAIPLGAAVTLTKITNSGKSGAASISPDGKLIAYMQNSFAGTGCLYVRQTGSNHEIQLLEPGDRVFGGTAFSSDGEYIYYVVSDKTDPKGALYRIRSLGGPPVRLLGNFNSMFSLSPDGRRVAFYRNDLTRRQQSLMIAQLDGSGEQALLARAFSEVDFSGMPAWSPDGKIIAFGPATVQQLDNSAPATVYGVDAASGETKPLTDQHWAEIGKMIWMPDGSGLVFLAKDPRTGVQIYHMTYPGGEVRRITNGVQGFGNYGLGITGDSSTLVADSWESSAQLWKVGADGNISGAMPLTTGDYDGRRGLSALPDGRVIYVARDGGEYDFWTVNEDGTGAKPVTADSFSDRQVTATPDGRHLIFTSDRAGGSHIFRADADGSHPQQLTFDKSQDDTPDCSPDGQWIIYVSLQNQKTTIWKVSIDGGRAMQLTDYECVAPAFAPNGKYISCIVPSTGKTETGSIAVIPTEGGPAVKQFKVIPFAYAYLSARWTPDSNALIFPREENQVTNLWRQPVSGEAPVQLTDFKTDIVFNFAYTRDGRNLILSRGQRSVNVVQINNFK